MVPMCTIGKMVLMCTIGFSYNLLRILIDLQYLPNYCNVFQYGIGN